MLLYLHIPFCDSKCFYCSFNSYVDKFEYKRDYIKAVLKQLDFEIKKYNIKEGSLKTIFIGGGTPSTIAPELYEIFFDKVSKYFDKDIEITIEANPNSASPSWIREVKELGVNRISFGVQSFNDKKLKYLGRSHSAKSAIKAIENAHILGIKNISLDLIFDTKVDDKKLLQSDINIAKNLPINHISSYSLTIEKGTKFYDTKQNPKDDIDEEIWFYKEIENGGFPRYEVSNFGKYICKHNVGYWEHREYIGIGAGAVGFKKDKRFYTHKDIEKYINDPLYQHIEHISKSELKEEKVLLALRSFVGLDREILNEKENSKVDILINEKKVVQKDGKIYNLEYLLSDEIALFILG